MKHKKTKCIRLGITTSNVAEWKCPKCNRIFECGSFQTKEMYCKGGL